MDGAFQGCKSINDCGVAIALALLRRVLPQSGKAFMETRKVSEWGELRESLEDWMSGREKGNFFRPLGGGPSENTRGYRVRESNFGRENVRGGNDREKVGSTSGYLTCYNCGERGHKSTECKKEVKAGGNWVGYGHQRATTVGRLGTGVWSVLLREGRPR